MDGTTGSARTATAPWWRVLLVPALGVATGACGAALTGTGGARIAGGSDTEALIGLFAAAVGCAVVVAWSLAAVLAVLAVLARHHRWDRLAGFCGRCSPALLRRAAATALGLQLLAAPVAVADDTPSPFWDTGASVLESPAPDATASTPGARNSAPHAPTPTSDATASAPEAPASTSEVSGPGPATGREPGPGCALAPDGESVPVPPAGSSLPRTGPSVAERTVDGAVTVLHGDTLWSLAAAHLGPAASDAEIARAWPLWYERNRHVLVDGPHRLLPGQLLLVPGAGNP